MDTSDGGVYEISFSQIMNFSQKYKLLLGATFAAGVGVIAVRRYFAGGRCNSMVRLDGKTVIITGANTGIGKETALDLARRGARVILACRDITKAERAAESIRKSSGNSHVVVHKLDLASLNSVRTFAKRIKSSEPHLNILINNAGVMACPRWETEDGFEMQFGTNHLGHFLLTNELLELLKDSTPSRVVTVSSTAHRRGAINWDDLQNKNNYVAYSVYAQSKLANILFTKELHRRMAGSGVTTYVLHPGVIHTQLWQYIPSLIRHLSVFIKLFTKTVEEGAQTSIYCAVAEGIEKDSGKYFSDCAVSRSSPSSQSDEDARRLWEVSEVLVGIKPDTTTDK